mmetsp:Transcript_20716/g.45033  ORF Transcript_20716/g.45033 Transcript_20716/m.45033 type:complete len:339 (+) Transcript_20716:31-1047(+)
MSSNDIYVINGFYAAMRAKYTKPGVGIYYYSVQWNSSLLSWADFRADVLGCTDPEKATPGSLRWQILQEWQSLGLPSKPNVGDNGVHGSASPLEGLAERMNWLGVALEDDETGVSLIQAGIAKEKIKDWIKDAQVDVGDGQMVNAFDAFEDLSIGPMLKKAQKIGGDPFEEPPEFALNQAFIFIKPHALTDGVKALVKSILREQSISIIDEGFIGAEAISSRKLVDNHYYAIANKASLSKPAELNPPAAKQEEFAKKFGITWQQALADGVVYNAVDACKRLGIDGTTMDKKWAAAKKEGNLLKFGGGFYAGKIPAPPPESSSGWLSAVALSIAAMFGR